MAPKFTSMAVSTCEEFFSLPRGAATRSATSCSQFTFQTANFKLPNFKQPSIIARIVCRGPGQARLPSLRLSPRQSEGDGAPRGATICSKCPRSLSRSRGAARRATQTSLRRPGLFAGVFLTAPGRAFRGRPKLGRPPSAKLLAGGPYWPPGGAPAPPGCVLARHARGRRIRLHHQDASR